MRQVHHWIVCTPAQSLGFHLWAGGFTSLSADISELPHFAGEYISVSSQKDSEEADIEKERKQQEKGPEARHAELMELKDIYVEVKIILWSYFCTWVDFQGTESVIEIQFYVHCSSQLCSAI